MHAAAGISAAVLAVAWIAACHLLMTRAPGFAWNGVVIVGPMLAWLIAVGVQRRWPLLALAAAAGLAALVYAPLRGSTMSLETLYVAQHATVHAALALIFATSLGAGREPLITALARRVHGGRLTPDMAAYCRRVTAVWTGYFGVMALLSMALWLLAPFAVWAPFANIATPLAMVTLFVGEYALRYRLHPEFERATLGDALRAWQQRSADDHAA